MDTTKTPTFVEIIDSGECRSTLHTLNTKWPNSTMAELANKDEWSKHNYYPANGHVGEIVHVMNEYTYIVKVDDKIFVPISKKGVRIISENEMNAKNHQDYYKGMDARQKKINDDYEAIMARLNQFK